MIEGVASVDQRYGCSSRSLSGLFFSRDKGHEGTEHLFHEKRKRKLISRKIASFSLILTKAFIVLSIQKWKHQGPNREWNIFIWFYLLFIERRVWFLKIFTGKLASFDAQVGTCTSCARYRFAGLKAHVALRLEAPQMVLLLLESF